jgi:hypothetical protein
VVESAAAAMTHRLIAILKNNALNVFTKSPSSWLMILPVRAVVQRQKIPLSLEKGEAIEN